MSDSLRAVPPFIHSHDFMLGQRVLPRPTAREYLRHIAFFLLTVLTTTFAGVLIAVDITNIPEPALSEPERWFDYIYLLPAYYAYLVKAIAVYAVAHPTFLADGLIFSVSLLAILLCHEMGHYIACRRYGVDATLPFFIPAPPLFLAGTFGAFIKIRSPIPSRRALFDIGVAGPLAGFLVIIPVAIVALLTAQPQPPMPSSDSIIIFNDPMLVRLMGAALGIENLNNIALNPFLMAAWIGLLVTSLNLLPVGQLDGGHAVYALFGRTAHRWIGRLTFIAMLVLAPLGFLWHGTPSGFVYSILLFIMLRVRHPQPEDEYDDLGLARTIVAIITLIVFVLSFMPFPVTIT